MIILSLKVVPKSSRTELIGWHGGELKIKIAATPEKGLANKELIDFMAKTFKVAKSHISLIGGESGRHKILRIEGITQEYADTIIASHMK